MLAANHNSDEIVGIAADFLDFGEGIAGNNEAAGCIFAALDGFAAQCKAVAVNGDDGQAVIFDLEECAGVQRTAFAVADGEDGLADHGAQQLFRQNDGILLVNGGQLGIVVGGNAHNGEVGLTAGDGDGGLVLACDGNNAVGQAADNICKQLRADDDGAGFGNVCIKLGINALFQVITGDAHGIAGLNQDAFQCRNGALAGNGTDCGCNRSLQQMLFTGKSHKKSPLLVLRREKPEWSVSYIQ